MTNKVRRPPLAEWKKRVDDYDSSVVVLPRDDFNATCQYIEELELRAEALVDAGHRLRHLWADDNAASAMQWDEDEKALRGLMEGQ